MVWRQRDVSDELRRKKSEEGTDLCLNSEQYYAGPRGLFESRNGLVHLEAVLSAKAL